MTTLGGRDVLRTEGKWRVLEGGARVHVTATVGARARVGDGAWVEARAWVGDGARVGADARVGDGARLGAGARVGADAWVGPYARVGAVGARSDARVPDGATVAVIGPLGTRGDSLSCYPVAGGGHEYVTGCFRGTFPQLEAASRARHGAGSDHYRAYGAAAVALWRITMGAAPLPRIGEAR